MLLQSTPSKSSSKTNIRPLEKDLKDLIQTLQASELITLFRNLQIEANVTSFKQFAKIALKCSECKIVFEHFHCKGYGRDEQQALINSIKTILQSMITSCYRIENIKKALKYCSRYKQPLISASKNTHQAASSLKKSIKKVEGIQKGKISKRLLEYEDPQEVSNKQNMSIKINESLNLNEPSLQENFVIDAKQIKIGQEDNIRHLFTNRPPAPSPSLYESPTKLQKKCSLNSNKKDCIYYEIYKHSQNEIRNLAARMKLLEEENSMLKELLLKDFNNEFFHKRQKQAVQRKTDLKNQRSSSCFVSQQNTSQNKDNSYEQQSYRKVIHNCF